MFNYMKDWDCCKALKPDLSRWERVLVKLLKRNGYTLSDCQEIFLYTHTENSGQKKDYIILVVPDDMVAKVRGSVLDCSHNFNSIFFKLVLYGVTDWGGPDDPLWAI